MTRGRGRRSVDAADVERIERIVDRKVGGEVERTVTVSPSGSVAIVLRCGARLVSVEGSRAGWTVAPGGPDGGARIGPGTVVGTLEEALALAAELLGDEAEDREGDAARSTWSRLRSHGRQAPEAGGGPPPARAPRRSPPGVRGGPGRTSPGPRWGPQGPGR